MKTRSALGIRPRNACTAWTVASTCSCRFRRVKSGKLLPCITWGDVPVTEERPKDFDTPWSQSPGAVSTYW